MLWFCDRLSAVYHRQLSDKKFVFWLNRFNYLKKFCFFCTFSFNHANTCIITSSFSTLIRKKATWHFCMSRRCFFPGTTSILWTAEEFIPIELVVVVTPPLPRDWGTGQTPIQVHAVSLIKIRLGERWHPISNQSWVTLSPTTNKVDCHWWVLKSRLIRHAGLATSKL